MYIPIYSRHIKPHLFLFAKMIKAVCVLFLCCYLKACDSQRRNNVCKNFQDYPNIDISENCWYNPDMFSTPENIARNHGFQFQSHKIETEDGYYLTLFRIQDKFAHVRKQPILVHHGLISSAVGFMTSGNKSLAFYLAKNGYDVWLANHRGNSYSLGHAHFSNSNPKYWDFSFHEIGLYDLPAVTEYIAHKTGNFTKIIYIGHSMGCTVCFVYSSLKSDHAQQYLKGFIALTPATSLKYIPAFWKPLTPLVQRFFQGLADNNITVLFPDPINLSRILIPICRQFLVLCLTSMNLIAGNDDEEFTAEDLMVTLSYHPARTSLKCALHFMQLILAKKFLQYDYGLSENYRRYNSRVPPAYPLENITIPVHMFYGLNDNLVSPEDVFWVFSRLKTREKSMNLVPKNRKFKFNHVNFLVSKHIETYLYKPLMRKIKHLEAIN